MNKDFKSINMIGDIFVDLLASNINVLPLWGTDTLSKIKIIPGGSALNASTHATNFVKLKNYPIKVNLFSSLGDDIFCSLIKNHLNSHFVNDFTVQIPSKSTGSCIVLSNRSDRSFITDRGVVDDLTLSDFNLDDLLSSHHIHIAGYYNCSSLKNDLPEFLKIASDKGKSISLNPQFDASNKWDGIFEIAPYLTFLICNTSELMSITKSENIDSSCEIILNLGCKYVIVTKGEQGADAYYYSNVDGENKISVICQSSFIANVI
jgi:sugar/nucleoside kinase (ribokinase family)